MKEGRKDLAFPAWLEARFERDTGGRRAAILSADLRISVIVYNVLLTGDWFLTRDTFPLAVILHALVTAWMLAVVWLMGQNPSARIRELAAASIPAGYVLQIVCIYHLSNSDLASHYLNFVFVAIVYANAVERLRYPHAVGVSVYALTLICAALAVSNHLQAEVLLVQTITFAASIYMTLKANFDLNRDFRRTYLLSLRDRLRLAEVDNEAKHDALTGLANRHLLEARAAELWRCGDDLASPVAAVLIDIDHFKAYNDLYGHPAGDACLKRVAACMTAELRNDEDLAVRFGGEEFLLLLPKTEMPDAIRVAERLRRAIVTLAIPHEGGERLKTLTATFGVASATISAFSFDQLVSAADVALYAAKHNGRNQVWPPLLRDGSVPDTMLPAIASGQ